MVDWSSSDKTSSEGEARRVSACSANQFQQFVTPDGRKFTELYNVQHLTSNRLDGVCRVTICTIQRLYAMLRSLVSCLNDRSPGANSCEETGRASGALHGTCGRRPVAYSRFEMSTT